MTITSGFLVNIGLNDIPPFGSFSAKKRYYLTKKRGEQLGIRGTGVFQG